MSLRWLGSLVCVFSVACGNPAGEGKEPKNAKEKQRLESKANGKDEAKTWGGWRYQGERNDCFFVVGRRCFKTENAACQAAKCKKPKTCETVGGGPAAVSCK
ncbi:MAG: hypothetical protein H0T79_14680 [Deltaproteobacteria bacterium]|nr:hypothetical protein [Deltaproteobacteria bacterium]